MGLFGSFAGRREKEHRNYLTLIGDILDKAGFSVISGLEERGDPFIFVRKPNGLGEQVKDLEFGGIRIFVRGKDIIAFRAQMNSQSQPYGETYQIEVKQMFSDSLKKNKNKAAEEVIRFIIDEVKEFFIHSGKAQAAFPRPEDAPLGIIVPTMGTDYASMVTQ